MRISSPPPVAAIDDAPLYAPIPTTYPSTCATFSKVSTVQFPFPVSKFEIVCTPPPSVPPSALG